MGSGFNALFDSLQQAAGTIDDVVTDVLNGPWHGPSGDYGHPGVQGSWAAFIEEARRDVQRLREVAMERGDQLRSAASRYIESDAETTAAIGKIGGSLQSSGLGGGIAIGANAGAFGDEGIVAGGLTGGIRDILDGGDAGSGTVEAQEGIPGGGFTGGLSAETKAEAVEQHTAGANEEIPGGGFTGGVMPEAKESAVTEEASGAGTDGVMSPETARRLAGSDAASADTGDVEF